MFCCVNTLEQGDLGEVGAMLWLASRGAGIYLPVGPQPRLRRDRRTRRRVAPRPGEDLDVLPQRSVGGPTLHSRRQPELERRREEARPLALRLRLRARWRRPLLVHPLGRPWWRQPDSPWRSEVLGIRGRARTSAAAIRRVKEAALQSPIERSGGCPSG